MTATGILAALRRLVADAVHTWAPGARGTWCRRQRRRLRESGGSVIWVRGPALPWAEWGAHRGYFAVGYMSGLAYLRPLPSSGA